MKVKDRALEANIVVATRCSNTGSIVAESIIDELKRPIHDSSPYNKSLREKQRIESSAIHRLQRESLK